MTLVREMGSINGRVVQTMFDVQPGTASRILSDLVDRNILVKTSKARRGPSVTYGPGKNFPYKASRKGSQETGVQGELEWLPDTDAEGEPHE